MGNITYLDDYRPHKMSEVICVKCGKRWISVRPVNVYLSDIDCPNCGPGYVIETSESLFDK